jgi:hypothetical protein
MCHAETTPYLIITDPEAPRGERADFSAHRNCRKFNVLTDWMRENQLVNPWDFGGPVGHVHDHS